MQTFAQSLASHSTEQTKKDINRARPKANNDYERDMLHDFSHDIVNKRELTKAQRETLEKILTRPQQKAAEGTRAPVLGPDGLPSNEASSRAYYGTPARYLERCLDCAWEGKDYMEHMREQHPELLTCES